MLKKEKYIIKIRKIIKININIKKLLNKQKD